MPSFDPRGIVFTRSAEFYKYLISLGSKNAMFDEIKLIENHC